jgi:environmental stress-induced protein Ves
MHARLLRPSDYRAMPWKNGLGTTHEIAVERSDGEPGFAWRVSMAEVAVSSPFSLFPGCDRTILLLQGDGMVLDSGQHGQRLLDRRFEPYAFKGEWQTDCRLVGGPCRDLNVIVDRARARAEVEIVSVTAPAQRWTLDGDAVLLLALEGTLAVTEASCELPPLHALLLHRDAAPARESALTVCASGGEATVLHAVFHRQRVG